jgi:Gpi18-like mannosyltransferase
MRCAAGAVSYALTWARSNCEAISSAFRLEPPLPSSKPEHSFLPDLTRPGSVRFVSVSATAMVVMHLVIWKWIAFRRHQPFGHLLTYWDANYYTAIARDGYSGSLFAFYPAYPLTLRVLSKLLGITEIQWLGAAFSTVMFAVFVFVCVRVSQRDDLPARLTPSTRLGWLFFLFSPASYIFHSHHTEALFLLLLFLSFYFSGMKRPGWGGLFGAFCALTRNQGVFVGGMSALLAAWVETTPARRVRAFLVAGSLSLLGVLGFLTFQTVVAGSPFAFMDAQKGWTHVDSFGALLKTFVLGNPWQSIDPYNVLWYVSWWIFLIGAVLLARRQPALGLYAVICLVVQLFQGEFVNTFRFAAPLFPLFFFLGDGCARLPRWFQLVVVLGLFLLNVATARHYGLGEWAY